jgi:hypothetical protein
MILENAREVTYRISTINEGPKILHNSPARYNSPATLKRALADLQILVNQAIFPHVKTLNLVLVTEGLVQEHFNVIFKLFVATGCIVTLEEVCTGGFGPRGSQEHQKELSTMINIAAKEWYQPWVTETPTADSISGKGIWRGMKVSWARHREWDRRFVVP